MPASKRPMADRFWEKVDKNGPISTYRPDLGNCWIWSAQLNVESGYGCFWLSRDKITGKNNNALAHRVSYELTIGTVPDELQIDHLCRVRNCVRPSHLEPVTSAQNTERGDLSFNGNEQRIKTQCINGHPFDSLNTKKAKSKYGCGISRQCRVCNRERTRKYRANKVTQ